MKNLNNKGQTLVLFVMLLPIMLFIMVLVFDIGKFICQKNELNNINYMVVSYGIEHYDESDIENELTKLIILNCDNLDSTTVSVRDNQIEVNLISKGDSIFGNVLNIKMFEVHSNYIGNIETKKIERIK